MAHNLATAAAATGLNRSTILRAIKSGKISAAKSELGEWSIEAAELHRVYAPVAPATERHEAPQPDATAHVTGFEAQVAALREVAALLRAQLDEVRQDREQWREQAAHWREQAQRLVLPQPAAQQPAQPIVLPKPVSVPSVSSGSRRRWWSWRRAG
jgi:hypothetical protein